MSKNIIHYTDHTGLKPEKFYKTTLFQEKNLLLGLNCLEPGQVQRVDARQRGRGPAWQGGEVVLELVLPVALYAGERREGVGRAGSVAHAIPPYWTPAAPGCSTLPPGPLTGGPAGR